MTICCSRFSGTRAVRILRARTRIGGGVLEQSGSAIIDSILDMSTKYSCRQNVRLTDAFETLKGGLIKKISKIKVSKYESNR